MSDETFRDVPKMHGSGATIETSRLRLRVPEEAHLDGWVAILSNVETARFLGGPLSLTQSWGILAKVLGHWQLRGFGFFSVILRSSDECVGFVGPWYPRGYPGREVGWALRRENWGQGLALEATMAVLQWVREELHWRDVIHCIHPDNTSSIALAGRIGSAFQGPASLAIGTSAKEVDYHIYGQHFSGSN